MTRSVVYGPSVVLDAGNNKWTNLADGVAADDAATVGQLGGGGGGGGATELDYVTTTSDLTVTATSAGTAQTYITGTSISLDGSTRVRVEFFSALVGAGAGDTVIELFRSSTDIGRIAQVSQGSANALGAYFDTPSAGSYQYIIKAWRATANGTIFGSLGCPSFLRVTSA